MKEEEIRLNFSKNLLALRKSRGLSQAQLASDLNYTDKAVSKWEKNETIPDITSLSAIAEYFDITVDDLIKDHDVVKKSNKKKNRFRITFSSIAICFVVVGLIYLILALNSVDRSYIAIPFASLTGGIVLIVLASLWFRRIIIFIGVSVTIWSLALIVMLFMNFNLFWVILIIAFVINLAFYPFLKIFLGKERKK